MGESDWPMRLSISGGVRFSIRSLTITVALAVATAVLPSVLPAAQDEATATGWRQLGGPHRNFISDSTGLADHWPVEGPPVIWSRPLGVGHSGIIAAEGQLFTMYRLGNGQGRTGPWDAEESVIAIESSTGKTLWEYKYPSKLEDFGYGAGPHSTPLLVGDRIFTAGTNKQIHSFNVRTGELLWSHDLVKDFNAPPLLIRPRIKAGYGCSPLAYKDTLICAVGGPGQSIMAFRQSDGSVVWKNGDFLVSEAPQSLITLEGQVQLVVFAGESVNGLDPDTGEVLWSHPHDPGNDFNFMVPLWGEDNIMFVSSAYKTGSRAIRLTRENKRTVVEELWFDSKMQFMFLNPIRLGDYVYGTEGTFGPAFLTGVNVKTGEAVWKERGFSRSSLVYADGKVLIMDEDGDLTLTRLSPEGMTVLARNKIFDTTSWTVPTLVGTTLYARDREKIIALDLGVR